MNINDLMEKAVSLFDSGDHAGTVSLLEPFLADVEYSSVLAYCCGISRVMSGDTAGGLACIAPVTEKCLFTTGNMDSESAIPFACFAAMQAALIAEFNIHCDHQLMSAFVEKYATFARDAAEKSGIEDIFNGASDMLSRIYYSPSGKPFLAPPSPPTLQIEPTNICNLKCVMCPRSGMKRQEGLMRMDIWVNILKGWSAKNTSMAFSHLVFGRKIRLVKSGSIKFFFLGESLLHPEFDSMISAAASEGCHVALQTNGTLLSRKDTAERLIESGVHEIGISIDGADIDSYEKIRKGAEWEKTVNGIRKLIDTRKIMTASARPRIDISAIISDNDAEKAFKSRRFITDTLAGVDSVRFINLDRSYSPDFPDENGELCSHGTISQPSYSTDIPLCMEPFSKLNILWDGTVTPCCHDIDGKIRLGSVTEHSIDEIWRSNVFSRLLQALASHDISFHPLCRSCRFPVPQDFFSSL